MPLLSWWTIGVMGERFVLVDGSRYRRIYVGSCFNRCNLFHSEKQFQMNFNKWIRLDRYGNIEPEFDSIKNFSNDEEMMAEISKHQRQDVYNLLQLFTW